MSNTEDSEALRRGIQGLLPQLYGALEQMVRLVGGTNLLTETRNERDQLRAEVAQLQERLASMVSKDQLFQMFERMPTGAGTPTVPDAGFARSKMPTVVQLPTSYVPSQPSLPPQAAHAPRIAASTGQPAKRPGRKGTEGLDEYLLAGHYVSESNRQIAKKFGIEEPTVRGHMARLGLKRPKQIRERRTTPTKRR